MERGTDPREGEGQPPDSPPEGARPESEWSSWERQKLELYRREHPDEEPAEPGREVEER